MARYTRITNRPPPGRDGAWGRWTESVTDALNAIPAFSIVSTTDGPESTITADSGTLLFDVGSSATTLWFKSSGNTTTGWQSINLT